MKLELHCHSSHSDGSDPACDVYEAAHRAGAEVFCLTDHDTFSGHEEVLLRAEKQTRKAHILRSMELTCRYAGRTLHILCYGLKAGRSLERLKQTLDSIQKSRRDRIHEICAALKKRFDIETDPVAILAATPGTPGRPHVAKALVEGGYARSVRDAFTRFLHDRSPANIPNALLSAEEGLQSVRQAGGKTALAHPHTVCKPGESGPLLQALKAAGLQGLEAFYGPYNQSDQKRWLHIAEAHGLVATGGSDYHGLSVNPDVPQPTIDFPDGHAGKLLAWLECA